MGLDRPSPDHANAKVILLISSHLEAGHYFNPHAQRVIDAKANGAKLIVFDTRLSHTATHADLWVSPYPGSEAAICSRSRTILIQNNLYNREFVRRWWNWEEYHRGRASRSLRRAFESFRGTCSKMLYASYTFEYAAHESGVERKVLEEIAQASRDRGHALLERTTGAALPQATAAAGM